MLADRIEKLEETQLEIEQRVMDRERSFLFFQRWNLVVLAFVLICVVVYLIKGRNISVLKSLYILSFVVSVCLAIRLLLRAGNALLSYRDEKKLDKNDKEIRRCVSLLRSEIDYDKMLNVMKSTDSKRKKHHLHHPRRPVYSLHPDGNPKGLTPVSIAIEQDGLTHVVSVVLRNLVCPRCGYPNGKVPEQEVLKGNVYGFRCRRCGGMNLKNNNVQNNPQIVPPVPQK